MKDQITILMMACYAISLCCYQVFYWALVDGCPIFRQPGGTDSREDLMYFIRP